MKINPHPEPGHDADARRTQEDLSFLLAQPSDKQKRPCPGCRIQCPCVRRSTACTCGCSNKCPEAPLKLSSEPERYPIEAGALPIVYGLTCLRIMSPCWSCEGHLKNDGSVLRQPQIWFYSDSIVYPQLFLAVIEKLLVEKILSHPWRISISRLRGPSALGSAFQIEPDDAGQVEHSPASFARTQRDFIKIGTFLESRIREIARTELDRLDT